MKTINKKLNSQSGVAILFAMLLFLVATVVSLVIIVAATSSIKRESSFKENIQRNIELDSTVLMLRNDLQDKKFTFHGDEFNRVCDQTGENVLDRIYIKISSIVINEQLTVGNGKFSLSGDSISDVVCSYEINFTNDPGIPCSVLFKIFNKEYGNTIYSRYTFDIDGNSLTWKYDRTSFKEVQ